MSGCDIPDDPDGFRLWQECQEKSQRERNDELHRFADFRRQYHDDLRSGLRISVYYEEHPGCACPHEEVLAAYNEKYGIVDVDEVQNLETMAVKYLVQ